MLKLLIFDSISVYDYIL